jgi:polyferredoxin
MGGNVRKLDNKIELRVKTSIRYTEPTETGIYANVAKYWVKVTTEDEEAGRGCVHCARCVEACTHKGQVLNVKR